MHPNDKLNNLNYNINTHPNLNPESKNKSILIKSAQEALKNSATSPEKSHTVNKLIHPLSTKNEQKFSENSSFQPSNDRDKLIFKPIKEAQEGVSPFTKVQNFFISLDNIEGDQNFEVLFDLYFKTPNELLYIIDSTISKTKKREELDGCLNLLSKAVENHYLVNSKTIQKKIEDIGKKIIEIDSDYVKEVLKIISDISASPKRVDIEKRENVNPSLLSEKNCRNLCNQYHIRYEKGIYMYRFLKIHIRLWNASAKYQEILKAIELSRGSIGFMTLVEANSRVIEIGKPEMAKSFVVQFKACYNSTLHSVIILKPLKNDLHLGKLMMFELTNAFQFNRLKMNLDKAASGGYIDSNLHDTESSKEKAAYRFAMDIEKIELDGLEIYNQVINEAIVSKAVSEDWLFEDYKKRINEDQFLHIYGRIHIRNYVECYLRDYGDVKISKEKNSKSMQGEEIHLKFRNNLAALMQSKAKTKKNDQNEILQIWDE